ncbi:MAG TPA: YceH family protein [Aquabacterium sp.]|uniref:YceH family protein n=1 Tax=Aquabacterium sp. TaxID=1872578 RepID=UPI002E344D91|nr:YceH family protein [Aquabacterium sp.]HEX5372202.1 YceH family protein [Aquabacterium sp.]
MSQRPLTAEEARVLAVLVEKQHTVPDSYPLSLNALTLGCNQKTARDPVMQLSEADVLQAINGLKELSLVNEVSGSRVVRFDHNAARGLGVPSQSVALLTMLLLRGPQTSAELRLHTERLHRFADISSVEGFLDELAEREPKRVVKLPRGPGERENRWAHLLCGEVQIPETAAFAPTSTRATGHGDELAAIKDEQARMAAELSELRALVLRMATELGVDPKG